MANSKLIAAQARVEKLKTFLEFDLGNISLLMEIGDLQHNLGELAASEQTYEKILSLQAGNEVATSRLASVYISQHRFADAEISLRKLAHLFDSAHELQHNLGIALIHQSKWEDGLNALIAAADGGIIDCENLRYQAYSLLGLGRKDEALRCAEAAQRIAHNDFSAGRVALLHLDLGLGDKAVHQAKTVLQRDPLNIDANVVMSHRLLEQQQIDGAEQYVNRILRQDPDNHRALLNKGLIQMYNQKIPQAITTLERTLELTPRAVGTWVTLGWAHLGNLDLEKAEATFRKTIEVDRTFSEGHGGLATILAMQEKTEEAKKATELARRLNKNSFSAAFALSLLLQQSGKEDIAKRLMTAMFNKRPGDGNLSIVEALNIYIRREEAMSNRGKPPQNRGPMQRTLH